MTRSKIFYFSFVFLIAGQIMSNEDYIIKLEDLNTVSQDVLSQTSNTKTKAESSKLNISEGINYKVKSGFGNTPSLPFSITLSTDSINFGELTPTNPIIRTVNLKINNAPLFGYSVIASQDHALKSDPPAGGEIIPNTTCDNGLCNENIASEWTNTLAYGFGYRCDNLIGVDCDMSFLKPNAYKQFPQAPKTQNIMSGTGKDSKEARISYKINISGSQKQGVYSNIINYIAVPNY